jgi:hypothetical protein
VGSLISSLDLYNHSTVPSLGKPIGPVRKLYLSYFRDLIIPIRRLYPPNQFTRPISRRPVPAGRLYLPVYYTGLFLSAFRICLSVLQVPFFQLFVPAYLLYTSLSFSFFVPAYLLYISLSSSFSRPSL